MGLRQIIHTIRYNRKNNKALLRLFKPYFLFLENGIYRIDSASRIIYKAKYYKKFNTETRYTYDGYFAYGRKKSKIKAYFSQIIRNKTFIINNKHNNYHNIIGIINSERDNIKLFDYSNSKVLTFYTDANKRNQIISNRLLLVECGYNTPHIFSTDEYIKNKGGILEQLVIKKDYNFEKGILNWMNRMLSLPKSKTCKSFDEDTLKHKTNIIENFLRENSQTVTIELFKEIVDGGSYLVKICHGDFYPLNYIFDGKCFYAIDYECVDYKFILYDFIFYIFKCYSFFGDCSLLREYFSGKYDIFLDDYFKKYGVAFNKEAKSLYFVICMMEYFQYKLNQSFYKIIQNVSSDFKNLFKM